MINPPKDDKNIAYSKNDIQSNMILIFLTSLLEILYQH
jgi:hypothetical protein